MPDSLNSLTLRKRATAEEIHADLQARIDRIAQREGKLQGCRVSAPKRMTPRGVDAPNWTVEGFPDLKPGCFTTMIKILDQVRMEYELIG
jgi:hypothetical protein